ncbi:VP3 [Gokushovirinae sp.]|nr:VP3 [Gokushovirinae sp.]
MKFRTQYDQRQRVPANAGTREHVLYMAQFDEFGNHTLVETGKEDLYAYIQSHKESVDIHVIMERFARGDLQALERRQAMFCDFTDFPTTYAGLLNAVQAGEQKFMSLPLEVRQKFDNSFQKWLAAMDDMPSFLKLMSVEPVNSEPAPEPKVEPAAE